MKSPALILCAHTCSWKIETILFNSVMVECFDLLFAVDFSRQCPFLSIQKPGNIPGRVFVTTETDMQVSEVNVIVSLSWEKPRKRNKHVRKMIE